FSAGVPANPLLDRYSIVTAAGALDVVHLGNRNTVSGGAWAFDASADGDQIGIQPSWLPSVDQSGPQVTHFATPIGISSQSEASFLYQISNGGGTFDVTFDFLSGASTSATLAGGDWFGGTLPGTNQVDNGNPENNLSVTEGAVDLSAFAGELLVAISFSNRSNANAGYAILAANLTGT
ncbi:MAG: hypothetical protein KDC48_24540, partial [Planctomycetes bacterium]|nr:hypothetical protein [Planctomycetota bacterium]